jgi:dCTP deaminase
MVLSDKQIKEKVQKGEIQIDPFDEGDLQPASYDLHLSSQFKVYRPHTSEVIDPKIGVEGMMEEIIIKAPDYFVLHPGSFALALIEEKTGVDARHVGRLEGKSSIARLGLIIHTTAGFLDPGNNLKLTLELFNASPLPIKLYPGMKIAQIAFEEMISACERPYGSEGLNSKYLGDEKIGESKMHLNFKQ